MPLQPATVQEQPHGPQLGGRLAARIAVAQFPPYIVEAVVRIQHHPPLLDLVFRRQFGGRGRRGLAERSAHGLHQGGSKRAKGAQPSESPVEWGVSTRGPDRLRSKTRAGLVTVKTDR